jgi:MGT family glycosyltransferase
MRAVVFTYPDPSHVLSSLPVFAELARRGEEVTIYSTEPYRVAIEDVGATYRPYRGTMGASSTGPFGGMRRRIEFAEQILPELLEFLGACRPDYVVLDAAANWGSVAANVVRLPAICYRLCFALHRDMCGPAEMVNRFYSQAPKEFVLQGMLDLAGYHEVAQRVDRKYGSNTGDVAASLECRCELNLVLVARALQIEAGRFDASYRFVGPCLGASAPAGTFPWHELSADPLIYISLGTVFNDRPEFFHACMEAFGGLPLQVVMSLGQRLDPASLGPAPANFLLQAYVPQVRLLARTALAITHAGPNSVQECARAGVPQLLFPQAGDQFMMADMVQRLGAGLRLSAADIAGPRLRELAQRVLTDPAYTRGAAALQRSMRESGGAAQAGDEILEFARSLRG